MDGFLNINKPAHITSFDVIRQLRRLQPKTKMGHLGTLDPMATGVLPIAVGSAGRLIEYIANRTKTYQARMVLGGISDTQDATGNITWISAPGVNPELIGEAVKAFTGTILQTPPMYSAVHYQGKRLYELARKGETAEVQPRPVKIEAIGITDIGVGPSGLNQVSIEVTCSEGTYIRTLCHDIGQKLGTGAYMDRLVRTRSGIFGIEEANTLETVCAQGIAACLQPPDHPLSEMPRVDLDPEQYARVAHGNSIDGLEGCPQNILRLYFQGRLAAIARCSYEDRIILKPLKVFNK